MLTGLTAPLRRSGSALRKQTEVRRFDMLVARIPLLATRNVIYNDAYYVEIDPIKWRLYERLVEVFYDLVKPATVVDVGCGAGFMLSKFAERGVSVRGIEGSKAAMKRAPVRDRIVLANLERGVPRLGRFDLCLCIEVAEHLSPRSGPSLVAGLTSLSDVVVFSSATPGQGGVAHINERPHAYWTDLFRARDLVESPLTAAVRARISDIPEPFWIHDNLRVFEVLSPQRQPTATSVAGVRTTRR